MTTHCKNLPQRSPRKYQDQHLSISQVNADIQKQKEDMQQHLRMLPGGVFKPTSASPSTPNRWWKRRKQKSWRTKSSSSAENTTCRNCLHILHGGEEKQVTSTEKGDLGRNLVVFFTKYQGGLQIISFTAPYPPQGEKVLMNNVFHRTSWQDWLFCLHPWVTSQWAHLQQGSLTSPTDLQQSEQDDLVKQCW